MVEKLSFTIENAEMVKENPESNFAVLSLDFFASGKNLHDMFVSEETLLRTSDTIKNCPIVWKYDKELDDIYTHDKDEVPCGFVPEGSQIQSRKLPDGRTMLSVVAYVWKRYTGEILNLFKRDGGKKPVSVEMVVFATKRLADGLLELLDFRYEGITVLGTFVTPAVPLANASILSFAQMQEEYKEVLKKEFSDGSIDLTIPLEVKENAKKAIELRKLTNGEGTSVGVSCAKYLIKNSKVSVEKINDIASHFPKYKSYTAVEEDIEMLLWGGKAGQEWAKNTLEELERVESMKVAYNLDLAVQKKSEKMEMNMPEMLENGVGTMSEEDIASMAAKAEEEAKLEEEKKKKEQEGNQKKFEFPGNFDMEKMGALFSDDSDADDEIKMAKEEIEKKEFADPAIVMSGMFAKMCKMAQMMAQMAEDSKVYMAENEQLRKFKADEEAKQKYFEVQKTLEQLSEKVVMSAESREEMVAESEKYSMDNIEAWKTYCKAKSFDFAVKDNSSKSDVVRVALPFGGKAQKNENDLWS